MSIFDFYSQYFKRINVYHYSLMKTIQGVQALEKLNIDEYYSTIQAINQVYENEKKAIEKAQKK